MISVLNIFVIMLIVLIVLALIMLFSRGANSWSTIYEVLAYSGITAGAITTFVSSFWFIWFGDLYPGVTMEDLRWHLAVGVVVMFIGSIYFFCQKLRTL